MLIWTGSKAARRATAVILHGCGDPLPTELLDGMMWHYGHRPLVMRVFAEIFTACKSDLGGLSGDLSIGPVA